MNIEVNGVSITLTKEQLDHINIELNKQRFKDYKDIKSFEDACLKLNINIEEFEKDFKYLTKREIACRKLETIIRALNDGWLPDWNNSHENKYFNWFDMSGGCFSYDGTSYYNSNTSIASVLCFKSRELAEHCAKIAINEYKDYLTA